MLVFCLAYLANSHQVLSALIFIIVFNARQGHTIKILLIIKGVKTKWLFKHWACSVISKLEIIPASK
jgi:hypothetical protein